MDFNGHFEFNGPITFVYYVHSKEFNQFMIPNAKASINASESVGVAVANLHVNEDVSEGEEESYKPPLKLVVDQLTLKIHKYS